MIDWQPEYPGEPQQRANVRGIVFLSAGANSFTVRRPDGRDMTGRRSPDGRDETGRFPWSAFAKVGGDYHTGHADTLDEAQRDAVRAAKQILRAALDECGDD